MTIDTLLKYLVGNREAILQIVATPRAVILGASFVLAAGFAREYDARDLLHEPWFLLVPLGASLATSFILYCLVFAVSLKRSTLRRPFWRTYRSFLSLYWMTAPLALLYALPVDRWFSAEGATAANLSLLALVSVWRVSLMVRVVQVYFGATIEAAVAIVMLFADSLALAVLFFTPLRIFNVMGGIPLSTRDEMILNAALWVGCLGAPTWIVWFVGVLAVLSKGRNWLPLGDYTSGTVRPALWAVAVMLILGWGIVLPFTQPEQQLRRQVETALLNGRVTEGIDTMSRHTPEDFPPYWDPPPYHAYGDDRPPLLDILDAVVRDDAAPWVETIYVEKLRAQLSAYHRFVGLEWQSIAPAEKDRYLRIFERAPRVVQNADLFKEMMNVEKDSGRKERLKKLYDAAEAAHPPVHPADY